LRKYYSDHDLWCNRPASLVTRTLDRAVNRKLDRDVHSLASQLRGSARQRDVVTLAERSASDSLNESASPNSRSFQLRADLFRAGSMHEMAERFTVQSLSAIIDEVAQSLHFRTPDVVRDIPPGRVFESRLPVRLDLAGGWSDTPPYCLERPARVLNMAMALDGVLPIGARVEAIADTLWELNSIDSRRCAVCRNPNGSPDPPNIGDPLVLLRAALRLTGYGTDDRITQGVRVWTWSNVPTGSGLGGSSILAAALIQALQRLAGRPDDERTVCELVLLLEQRIATGGGWQDQIGGLFPGVKCISSRPTAPLRIDVEPVPLSTAVKEELQSRLVIAFTGQERAAKDVLRTVVSGYLRRDGQVLATLRRLVDMADAANRALCLGDIDGLGAILDEVWLCNQHLDPHCSNPSIDAILKAVRPWTCGAKLAGAGGGGFLGIIAKDAQAAQQVRGWLQSRGHRIQVYRWELWEQAPRLGQNYACT
jgi:fucokinase